MKKLKTMINLSPNHLLFVEPRKPLEHPINDELTIKLEKLLGSAIEGPRYRGFHICTCGCNKRSECYDLYIGEMITNSLALHYLRDHRSEIPQSELEKLKNINAF